MKSLKLFIFFAVINSVIPFLSYAYNCNEGISIVYRADFKIENSDGLTHPNAFVYSYPKTQLKHNGNSFNRGNGNGNVVAHFSICVPKGMKAPEFIPVNCVIKDRWDGDQYEIKKMRVKFYPDAGHNTIMHPIFIHKKGERSFNNSRRMENRNSKSMAGHYNCNNGTEIEIVVRPDGSWSISNDQYSLGGGGGGFRAAEKAAKRLCR